MNEYVLYLVMNKNDEVEDIHILDVNNLDSLRKYYSWATSINRIVTMNEENY